MMAKNLGDLKLRKGLPEEELNIITDQKYHRLGFKYVKELKVAVSNYGPKAPFTLSLLEIISD